MPGMRRVVQIADTRIWVFERWGLSIPLYVGDDGEVYVPVRYTCQQLGISVSTQLARTREDKDLIPGIAEMPEVTEGGLQKLVALRWREAAWWLATIDSSKVRRDIREDLDAIREALKDYVADLLGGKRPVPALAAPHSERGVIAISSRDEYVWACLDCGARHKVLIVNGEPTMALERESER